jgi:phosphatidylserine synthase
MVSRWKFPSLKALHFRLPSLQLMLLITVVAIFLLYGILYFLPLALMIIAWGYILLGLTLSTIRWILGKKSKTLEDFEAEDEDID